MQKDVQKTIHVGIDTATTGSVAITEDNKVIAVLKYPNKEYDKNEEKIIDAKIKILEQQERTKTKIKELKAEKKALKRRAVRNYKAIYDFILPYKDRIQSVIIEEPIRQVSGMLTSIDAIFANAQTLGVYTTICSILELPYELYSPTQWHKFFNYDKDITSKLTSKERREKIKELSIKYCREHFENADDFIILPKHKNPDDNIAEAILLSLVAVQDAQKGGLKFSER